MRKTAAVRKLLSQPGPVILPGIQDCLQARIFERQGFPWIYLGGYNASASFLGLPDLGLLSRREIVDHAGRVARAIDVPLIVDADDGFGNPVGVMQTVREFEAAGVAGIHLEDQVAPKRCGHFEGKQVISKGDMVQKIRAARDARKDDDFLLIVRTDARSVNGLEDAIDRARAYHRAGAEVLFVESPYSLEEAKRIGSELSGIPLMWNAATGRTDDGGKTPWVSPDQLAELGWKIILLPCVGMQASAMALKLVAKEIFEKGATNNNFVDRISERFMPFNELNDLTGATALMQLQSTYATTEKHGG